MMKVLPVPLIVVSFISVILFFSSLVGDTYTYIKNDQYSFARVKVDSFAYRSSNTLKYYGYYAKIEGKWYGLIHFSEDDVDFNQYYESKNEFKVFYFKDDDTATYFNKNYKYLTLKHFFLAYFLCLIPILLFLLLRYSYHQLKAYAPYGLGDNNEPLTKEQSDEKFKD